MDHFYATPASQDSGMRSCIQHLALLAWWKASTIWKGQLSDACLVTLLRCAPFPMLRQAAKVSWFKICSLCQIHHATNRIQDIFRLPARTRGLLGSNAPPLFGWWIDDMNLSLPFAAPFVHYMTPLHCLDEQRVLKTVAGAGVLMFTNRHTHSTRPYCGLLGCSRAYHMQVSRPNTLSSTTLHLEAPVCR